MEHQGHPESVLFASPIEHFVAQVRWTQGEGWRLWVSSWDRGDAPGRAHSNTYTSLTADECIDVLCAEQLSRCEWLRP